MHPEVIMVVNLHFTGACSGSTKFAASSVFTAFLSLLAMTVWIHS